MFKTAVTLAGLYTMTLAIAMTCLTIQAYRAEDMYGSAVGTLITAGSWSLTALLMVVLLREN